MERTSHCYAWRYLTATRQASSTAAEHVCLTGSIAFGVFTCGNDGGNVTRTAVERPSGSQRGISNKDLEGHECLSAVLLSTEPLKPQYWCNALTDRGSRDGRR